MNYTQEIDFVLPVKKNELMTDSMKSGKSKIKESSKAFELLLKQQQVYKERTNSDSHFINGVMIATICSVSESQIQIKFVNTNTVTIAKSMVHISDSDVNAKCAVMFQQGLIDKPIIMGMLLEPDFIPSDTENMLHSNRDTVVNVENESTEQVEAKGAIKKSEVEAESIPEFLHIKAQQQIILQCGDAILYMDAEGNVEMRGNRIITHSTGLNRIKGASVKIN